MSDSEARVDHQSCSRCHLSGRDPDGLPFVAGVYPLLLDETCFFLVARNANRVGPLERRAVPGRGSREGFAENTDGNLPIQ